MTPENLNPKCEEMVVGIRKMRMITIWPLSLADQFRLSDAITEVIQEFMQIGKKEQPTEDEGSEDQTSADVDAGATARSPESILESLSDVEFIKFIIDLIKKNLLEIIGLVTDDFKDRDPLVELTNEQTTRMAELIFQMNYEAAIKNVQSLFERVRNASLSKRPSLQS